MFAFLFRGARNRTLLGKPASRRRSFVPRLDVLEDRSLPSTLTVTNLADWGVGSLRGQLAAAAPGDTIDFAPAVSGTIALGEALTLDRDVSVVGNLDAWGNPLVTLTSFGREGSTDLTVNAGVTASVSGLTFTGATEQAVANFGSLTLSRVAVTGNRIGYWVGFGYTFLGTIYNEGTLAVQDSRITDNVVNIEADTIGANGGGGGIWNTSSGTLTVTDSTIANNAAPGGAAYPGYTFGGGISNDGGTATISGSTITGNSASAGGGIYSSGPLTVTASTISANTAQYGDGGGIYAFGNGTINTSTLAGNTAEDGGGIYLSGSNWSLANSTVAENQVWGSGRGAGVFVAQQTAATVINSTIALNTAGQPGGQGGGIYVANGNALLFAGGSLALLNSTVAHNQSAGTGGGLWIGATRTQVSLANTIVAGNTAAEGGPDVSGPVLATSAYNLVGNGDGSSGLADGINGNRLGTTASPIDPRLGSLRYNGGPTQTMALLAGSPALEAGDPALVGGTDQRGGDYARVSNGRADIGAFELQPAPHPVLWVTIGDASVLEGNSGTATLRFTVTLSALSPDAVTVDYATADGTATAGLDYSAASGTLTFRPGETRKTIAVTVLSDRIPEPNKTFAVKLTNLQMATVANGAGAGTILDDEPRISIGDVNKLEGKQRKTTLFLFTVALSAAYDQPVTVSFRTTDGTATTADTDYLASTGTLTFNPGETTRTITIVVNGDSKREANETFYLDLFGLSSNSLFTKNRGIGTILNDD